MIPIDQLEYMVTALFIAVFFSVILINNLNKRLKKLEQKNDKKE